MGGAGPSWDRYGGRNGSDPCGMAPGGRERPESGLQYSRRELASRCDKKIRIAPFYPLRKKGLSRTVSIVQKGVPPHATMTARNEKRSELPPGVLELLLLKGLARGSAHGYGLARWVEGRSEGALLVEEGSLYPALHRLQRKGLVCSDWGRTESGRRARFYTLEVDRNSKRAVSVERGEARWGRGGSLPVSIRLTRCQLPQREKRLSGGVPCIQKHLPLWGFGWARGLAELWIDLGGRMKYRCVATSKAGFVQQLAVQYVTHGYWFYHLGRIPDGKDAEAVDAKIVERYDIDVSSATRCRRKRAGRANVQYLRLGRDFVLIATKGEHRFFEDEPFRNAKRDPIKVHGYSISPKNGRTFVRIERETYLDLKAELLELATKRRPEALASMFWNLPFEPYAPVFQQFLQLYRAVNRARVLAGYESVPFGALRNRRRILHPFGKERALIGPSESSLRLEA